MWEDSEGTRKVDVKRSGHPILPYIKVGSTRLGTDRHTSQHRPSAAPAVSTAQQLDISPPLTSSLSFPTNAQLRTNITSSFPSTGVRVYEPERVMKSGYSLMFDEVRVESRVRYDPKTNAFIGVCCEHANHVSLEFAALEDLE